MSMRGFLIAMLTTALAGCGPAEEPDPPKPKAKPKGPPSVARIEMELPEVAEPFPADDGRIEVAKPEKWHRETPRVKNAVYLCRQSQATQYPRIYIFAEDYPGLERVNEDIAAKFAASVRSQLKLDQRDLVGEVSGVILGEFVGAMYRRRGQSGGIKLDRVFLVTVIGGRKFTLELRAPIGTADDRYLYAVAKGTNFSPKKESGPGPLDKPKANEKKKE